jgi:hypothetical protein
MSHNNIINEVIKENPKKNSKQIIENNNLLESINIIEKDKDKNNSFNQLLSLQILIQKHSGLKGLCKKNS